MKCRVQLSPVSNQHGLDSFQIEASNLTVYKTTQKHLLTVNKALLILNSHINKATFLNHLTVIFGPSSTVKSGNITTESQYVLNRMASQSNNKYSTCSLSFYSYYHYHSLLIKCDILAITLKFTAAGE